MDPQPETDAIKARGLHLGADFVSIADAAGFLNPDYVGNRPQEIMPGVKSVIIIGVTIPRGCILPLPKGRAEYTNTLMAGTATLRVIAFRIARDIETCGFLASIVPTEGSEFGMWYAEKETLKADISLKYAAYLAGLGTYGINQLLITPDFGSRVRMTAILTDAFLEPGHPSGEHFVHPECAGCHRCVRICPAGALSDDGTINARACSDYLFSTLGGLRCGMCIRECPL
jgi:epoxyqueuosine reductase QueG